MDGQLTTPRTFSATLANTEYDFTVTNASNNDYIIMNVARQKGSKRKQFGRGLTVDRHSGEFEFTEDLQNDIWSRRSIPMKINEIPAKILSVAWRSTMGILGMGNQRIAFGSSDFAIGWNLGVLFIIVLVLSLTAVIGIYVIIPLLGIAIVCFLLEILFYKRTFDTSVKEFMEEIAENIRDMVEVTVDY
ncbi:hypothetical protein [Profundibacter sp.]